MPPRIRHDYALPIRMMFRFTRCMLMPRMCAVTPDDRCITPMRRDAEFYAHAHADALRCHMPAYAPLPLELATAAAAAATFTPDARCRCFFATTAACL